MEFHELANLFPMMQTDEIDKLAEDIKQHGLQEPIITLDGKILDGRNRYSACLIADVEIEHEPYSGSDPLSFVLSKNLHRRHLNESQRAMIAARLANLEWGQRADRVANLQVSPVTQSQAAQMLSVSPRLVADAVRVKEQADPETIMEVERGNVAVSKVARDFKRADRVEQITRGNKELTSTKLHQVIYADPPWEYDFSKSDSREIENQYPTMSIDEICALPIDKVADSDCVLFLWATSPKLREALQVIDAWGFDYKTCGVWVKDKIGMGYYFRQRHELLLVAARGNLPVPKPDNRFDSVIEAERTKHSQKPESVYEMLEAMYPEFDKCELFARNKRKGWGSWGNQSDD